MLPEVNQGRDGQWRVFGKVECPLPALARCLNAPIQLTLDAQGLCSCFVYDYGEQLPWPDRRRDTVKSDLWRHGGARRHRCEHSESKAEAEISKGNGSEAKDNNVLDCS